MKKNLRLTQSVPSLLGISTPIIALCFLMMHTLSAQTITNRWAFNGSSLVATVGGNDLIAVGNTSFGTDKDGAATNALAFADASGARVTNTMSFATTGTNCTSTTSFAVSAWVKLTAYQSGFDQQIITSKGGNSGNSNNMQLYIGSGSVNKRARFQVWFQGGGNSTAGSSTDIPLNTWTHIMGVVDIPNLVMTVYINGVSSGTTALTAGTTLATATNATKTNYQFGSKLTYSAPTYTAPGGTAAAQGQFIGSIDDIRAYADQALTASQVLDIYNAGVVLPIELQIFKAKSESYNNLISWITASEKDNAEFSIERSSDGINFTSIGRVKGSGSTNTQRSYSFSDEAPLSMNYYRLRQTDFNGTSTVSNIVSVSREKGGIPTFYPTVTRNEVTISIPNDREATVFITNSLGQTVFTKEKVTSNNTLNISHLTAGTYFVTIKQNGIQVVSRLIKQ